MSTAAAEGPQAGGPFSRRAIAVLLAVGIVAFCAFLVLEAYGSDPVGDRRGGNNALSMSAVGFAGLVELLRSRDIPVAISRGSSGESRPSFLVFTPPATGTPLTWAGVAARLAGANARALIVLPKWRTIPKPDHPGWVEEADTIALAAAAALLPLHAEFTRRSGVQSALLHSRGLRWAPLRAVQLAPIDRLQSMKPAMGWEPLLLDEDGGVVLAVAGSTLAKGPAILVLTDPDLLDTQGLKEIAGARAALTTLEILRNGAPVTFEVTQNGFGRSRNLLQLLFEPPLLGATLCAAAGALLMLIMALHRFGPAAGRDRVLDFGKRALAENSARLIQLAGREIGMAVPYAQLTRTLVIRDIGAPARQQQVTLDRFLDAASSSRGLPQTYTNLAVDAAGVTDKAMLLSLARRLHHWSEGMRNGRR